MLRVSITVPASIPVTRITTYSAADSRMCIKHPGKYLVGVDWTTDVTIDVEEHRLPALSCSLGPTFTMSSVRLPDLGEKTFIVRIYGGCDLDGRVVAIHKYRMDADEDCGRRNDNLGELDDYAYVVEEVAR